MTAKLTQKKCSLCHENVWWGKTQPVVCAQCQDAPKRIVLAKGYAVADKSGHGWDIERNKDGKAIGKRHRFTLYNRGVKGEAALRLVLEIGDRL